MYLGLLIFYISVCNFYVNSLRLGLTMTSDPRRMDFFATTAFGLERTLAKEISSITGVRNVVEKKGSVSFEGSVGSGLEALLWLRTPLKLMERLSTHNTIRSKNTLYEWLSENDWQHRVSSKQTIKCDTILGQNVCHELNHSHFTSLTMKNAIIDQLRASNEEGLRPSVDTEDPDLLLSLYLHQSRGTLYRVWSGEKSMHKRGYRPDLIHKGALRESTAAALLLNTEWLAMCQYSRRVKSDLPVLCDPMCGSGTIPIEAALLAADTAPGLLRYAPPGEDNKSERGNGDRRGGSRMEHSDARPVPNPLRWIDLADTTAPLWEALWNEAVQRDQRAHLKNTGTAPCVYANDVHAGSVDLAVQAAKNAGVQHMIQFSTKDISRFRPTRPVSLYVTNPPWDNRLDGAADAAAKLNDFSYPAGPKIRSADPSAGQVPMWILNGGDISRSYLPTRPTDTLRLRVASTDMTFCNYPVE